MQNETARDAIERLEDEIERLTLKRERCRKLSLAAKTAIAAGAAWIVLTLTWIVPFTALMIIAAMAAVIGGVVLLGSNSTTWTQTEARLRASEAMRAEMIERLQMRVVDEGVRRLH